MNKFALLGGRTIVSVLLLFLGVGLIAHKPPAAYAAACTTTANLVNQCRPWFGAAAKGNPGTPTSPLTSAQTKDQVYQFGYLGGLVGNSLDIERAFNACTQSSTGVTCAEGALPFAAGTVEQHFATQPGTYADLNWKPATNWAEAGGGNAIVNSEIAQVAQNVKALAPAKVFLTVWHEPQNDVSAFDNSTQQSACTSDPNFKGLVGTIGTPAQYVAMWQNVENIFAQQGVTNVIWSADYQGTPTGQWDCLVQPLYPGNNLTNWVLFDTYSGAGLKTWDQSVGRMYNVLKQQTTPTTDFLSKPWGVAEFGDCNSSDATQISQYFGGALSDLNANAFPNLKMYMVYASTGNGASLGCLTDYDSNGTYDSTKQSEFNQFANAVLASTTPPDSTPPSPPTGLTATANGPTETDLSWQASTDNVGVAGYGVYRDGTQIATVNAPAITYADTGLTAGQAHQYTVTALDTAGNASSPSASAGSGDRTAPSAPSGLTTTLVGATEVDLGWQPATDDTGVAGYNIYRNGAQIAQVTSGTTYQDTGLADGGTYQYTVAAYDAAGNVGGQSQSATVSTPDITSPSIPSGLTAIANGPTEIDLTWQSSTDNTGVTGYNVYRDGTQITQVTSGTSYSDTGLTTATSYSYTVSAFDAAGNISGQSAATQATTLDNLPPSTPVGLTATATSPSQINLSWFESADNVGVTGYKIYRNGAQVAQVTSGTIYTDDGLNDATTYTYTVAAYDAAGNTSAPSAEVSATTPDGTPPSVPTGLSASVGSGIALSWTAATDNVGVTGYQVYRNGTKLATASGTTYSDNTVQQGSTYTYTVAAYDAAGNVSAQSAPQPVVFPDTTAPSSPGNFKLTLSSTSIALSWTAATDNVGVTGYQVYRNGAKFATTTSLGYTDTTVQQGRTYQYYVAAYDAAANLGANTPALTQTFPDTKAPTAPTNLKATPGTKLITLTWSASTDNVGVTGYRVYRGSTLIATVSGTTLIYSDKNLTTGTVYSYHLTAIDAAGNASPSSTTVSARAK